VTRERWLDKYVRQSQWPLSFLSVVSQGVTFCGDSKANDLTMNNVPWHREVVDFVSKLAEMLPEYEIASEHEHSNCVLLAHKKVSGSWQEQVV